MEIGVEVSIIIPCLNEEKTIKLCIDEIKKALELSSINGEIIVSDNGSSDSSVNIAKEAGATVVFCNEKGYGATLRFGFANANGKYLFMADGDNTYDFSQLPEFLKTIKSQNCDMVLGSRFKGKISKGAMPFINRYIGNPALTFIFNILYKSNISDTQSGIRLFKKECFDNIKWETSGMEFATELIARFVLNGYKIVEIPTVLKQNPQNRKPHLRPFSDGMRILKFMIKTLIINKKV